MKGILFGMILAMATGVVMAAAQPALPGQLLGQYYAIQKNLASDSLAGVSASASQIANLSRQAAAKDPQARAQLTALANAAGKLKATDLKSARNGFGDLSDSLIAYVQAVRAKRNPPYQFFCSMVKKSWLQPDKETRNPYYGSSMPTCGELVQADPSAGHDMGNMGHTQH